MLTSRNLAALGAMAPILALAGCGGGSKLSQSDLAKKAGPICQKATKDLGAISQPGNLLQDANAAATYFGKLVPIADRTMNDLRALKPVDSVKTKWNAYLDLQQQEVDAFRKILGKAKAKDTSGVQDLQAIKPLDNQVNAAARAAGVPACGQGTATG
jgi:hypothetical protein